MADHGWLKSAHTFSFADYQDPRHMGFSALRVINEDRIEGGSGFPAHGHRDMEIITVVLKGALEHKDTLGNQSVILPGEVQRMSAGTGVRHSEYNHLRDEETHFYQLWILPDRAGHEAGYQQKSFARELETRDWVLAVSRDGAEGSLRMNQDAELWLARLRPGSEAERRLDPKRAYWVQVAEGEVTAQGESLKPGDGLAVQGEEALRFRTENGALLLFFDLPG